MWEKKGLLFNVDGTKNWARSYASVPVADKLENNIYRIYYSPRNEQNHSSVGFSAMMQLWGTNMAWHWLPDGFETGIQLDSDAASRMSVFHATHLRNMAGYKEARVKTVEVSSVDDGVTCSECRKISGKKYKLENVPELPYAKCTCEIGCRCTTIAGEFRWES